ncbi:MAG: type II secretion system protein [Kiritimatiellia bacterium]
MSLKKTNPTSLRYAARAFTLVELMVVVAIIAGLLLMITPNVRRHQARARSTQCQNNLRQYGIAMAQYMADWNGYFIFPGGAGSKGIGNVTVRQGFDARDFADLQQYDARVGSGHQHYWSTMIRNYIPLPMPRITGKFLQSGENCVRICPEVNRNVFIPGHPQHKGIKKSYHRYFGEIYTTDFEIDYSEKDAFKDTDDVIFGDYFTTYGINLIRSGEKGQSGNYLSYYQLASNIPSHVVAFIDWNAEEGWEANIVPTNNAWQYTGRDRHGNAVNQGDPKNDDWWHTEIGFYHPGKDGMVANYVAMDGSVHSVSSNEISTNFFR